MARSASQVYLSRSATKKHQAKPQKNQNAKSGIKSHKNQKQKNTFWKAAFWNVCSPSPTVLLVTERGSNLTGSNLSHIIFFQAFRSRTNVDLLNLLRASKADQLHVQLLQWHQATQCHLILGYFRRPDSKHLGRSEVGYSISWDLTACDVKNAAISHKEYTFRLVHWTLSIKKKQWTSIIKSKQKRYGRDWMIMLALMRIL